MEFVDRIKASDTKLHGLQSASIAHKTHHIDKNVKHFDASYLDKDIHTPLIVHVVRVLAALCAAIVGILLFIYILNNVIYANNRSLAEVTEILSTTETLRAPQLMPLLDAIDTPEASLTQQDLQYFISSDEETIFYIGTPDADIDEHIQEVLATNIGKLTPTEAATYVPLWWQLGSDTQEHNIKLRFVSMDSKDPMNAIDLAMSAQGWEENKNITVSDSGVDSVGNTFKEGTLIHGNTTYNWRIAACQLNEVYDFIG
ncbi:MAG: hypothetical protein IJV62_00530, partial [Eggerthellaceae bacterium]|nr:hypothetical protein [Eggerthellaceae bacterium]